MKKVCLQKTIVQSRRQLQATPRQQKIVKHVIAQDDPENEGENEYSLYAMGSMPNPLIVDVTIDGIQVPTEIDNGCISIVNLRENISTKLDRKRIEGLISTVTDIHWTYTGSERLY